MSAPSEKQFESDIVAELVGDRRRAAPPDLYVERRSSDFDPDRCLLPDDAVNFVVATQPEEWRRLKEQYGAEVKERFLKRLAREIGRRGTLDVLRKGVKDRGCHFRLAYFRPHSGLNQEHRERYKNNLFAVVRQLHFGAGRREAGKTGQGRQSLDLALFLNGLPLFTAELKSPLNGQTYKHAIAQYQHTRPPSEPLFAFGRCLAHFAVDPSEVHVTTHLKGETTFFLPFNRGHDGGAGNPPVPLTERTDGVGYATSYLWREIWRGDSVLNLIQHFIHLVTKEGEGDGGGRRGRRNGQPDGRQRQLFPRYHQLETVRALVGRARQHGAGHQYLVQHSAGSGKSYTIAWLAHWLSVLHDDEDRRVFDSIVVITDRRVLDRQLQETVRQFEQTLGVVENIDRTSRQLKAALEAGKTIIVTTLQKFPVIVEEIGRLPGKRFAVIVDEAHSSQAGESTKALKTVLSAGSLEEAEEQDSAESEDLEDLIVAEMRARGRLANASTFAFTATPKNKTLELFGTRQDDGSYQPFRLYSMRQAIEEGFILDVLASYTTYKTYWRLLKTIEDDPRYDRSEAASLLKSFVELHPHSIDQKVAIMVDHFHQNTAHAIQGRAKAMIVTRSRLHCVRTKQALDRALAERGYPYESLVAFSGTVLSGGREDGGDSFTESQLNGGIPETQTAEAFKRPEVRFLVVANKFQTGFDQPLLHTMYVDKRLGGVNAVQTLSRLNRTHPRKDDTMVLDFANDADTIRHAFEPYYEATLLSEGTDPNLLYDRHHELLDLGLFTAEEVDAFAAAFFDPAVPKEERQPRLYRLLDPVKERAGQLDEGEQIELRSDLKSYARLYAFLSQLITFEDTALEKLYVFARYLHRYLDAPERELPLEVKEAVDLESLRVQRTDAGAIAIDRGRRTLDPAGEREVTGTVRPEELTPLSQIIAELNERYGTDLGEPEEASIGQLMERAVDNENLRLSVENNSQENAYLAFKEVFSDLLQELIDTNFQLYKKIADDRHFSDHLMTALFDDYRKRVGNGGLSEKRILEEIADGETKHREFKSTLRHNLHTGKNDKRMTHAALKTIAAFANSEGGVLYLGVADDGEIVGIEPDGFASGDKFLLHLNNAVKSACGPTAAARLDATLWALGEKQVCRVACPPSPTPVYLEFQGEEKFYVRSGPASEALGPSAMQAWIGERFGG